MRKPKIVCAHPHEPIVQEIYEGMTILENDIFKIEIRDLELDYSSAYYEGDDPEIKGKVVTTFKK